MRPLMAAPLGKRIVLFAASMLVVCGAGSATVLATANADDLGGQTVLLDFYAEWCGPCRQMMPVVEQLRQAGYPVRKVNIEREPELARRFRITAVPTFVMLVNGKETDRIVGPASLDQLMLLCRLAPQRPPQGGVKAVDSKSLSPAVAVSTAGSQSATSTRSMPSVANSLPPFDPQARYAAPTEADLISATVRIRIDDPNGRSTGSGTIIDARGGEALIITCGHLFRESQGQLPIRVDLFGPQRREGLPAQLIYYDDKQDIGFLSIRPNQPVVVARVAPPGYPLAVGDPIFSVGCTEGDPPTVWQGKVTGINKYLGPANIEASSAPVVGRSGGGLFSSEGFLVGVCNAADPPLDEGIYLALREIHRSLDRLNLAMVYRTDSSSAVLASATPTRQDPGLHASSMSNVPSMPPSSGIGPSIASSPGNSFAMPTPEKTTQMPPSQAGLRSLPGSPPEAVTLAAGLPLPIPLGPSTSLPASFPAPGQGATSLASTQGSWGGSDATVAGSAGIGGSALQGLSREEKIAWEEISRRLAAGYEIVCVVRPMDQPHAPSEVIVLREMSPEFLALLKQQGMKTLAADQKQSGVAQGTLERREASLAAAGGLPLVPITSSQQPQGSNETERNSESLRNDGNSAPRFDMTGVALPAAVIALTPRADTH